MLLHLIPATKPAPPPKRYDDLVRAVLSHAQETPVLLQALLDENPAMPRAHAAKALMLTTLARGELQEAARASAMRALDLARGGGHPASERVFASASVAAANGDWRLAIDRLEDVLAIDPDDALAAKMSHALRFMLGDKAGMLRSIRNILNRLSAGNQYRGFLLGCHAFALEESGFYTEAETAGRHALELEQRDAWGLHAVSHVHEMTGRADDGIAWISSNEMNFVHCNNFGGHLFWHLALFKLEKGAIAEVLDLYDRKIRHDRTDDFRDIANGASLLMRLELEGYEIGDRWEELADKAEARIADRSLVFADLHYLMALIGAGRNDKAAALAQSFRTAPARHGAQRPVVDKAGRLLVEGMMHFAAADMEAAAEKLLAARRQRVLVGGSDAQRDVFEQVTIEAAIAAGDTREVEAILETRLRARNGRNRFAERRLARLVKPGGQEKGRLGLVAALAFATPAH